MPHYVVQRKIPERPLTPMPDVAGSNQNIVCVKSYLSDDRRYLYSVYDGPDPESVCAAVERNGARVDRITKVSVIDFLPIFYR